MWLIINKNRTPWRHASCPALVQNGLNRTPCGLVVKPARGLAMKPHEAHAKTEEPSEAQSITNTTRAARPGVGIETCLGKGTICKSPEL